MNKSETTSKGLGDTVEKVAHAFNLDKVAESVAKVMGKKDCGCTRRKEKLNSWFPYDKFNLKNILNIFKIKK